MRCCTAVPITNATRESIPAWTAWICSRSHTPWIVSTDRNNGVSTVESIWWVLWIITMSHGLPASWQPLHTCLWLTVFYSVCGNSLYLLWKRMGRRRYQDSGQWLCASSMLWGAKTECTDWFHPPTDHTSAKQWCPLQWRIPQYLNHKPSACLWTPYRAGTDSDRHQRVWERFHDPSRRIARNIHRSAEKRFWEYLTDAEWLSGSSGLQRTVSQRDFLIKFLRLKKIRVNIHTVLRYLHGFS